MYMFHHKLLGPELEPLGGSAGGVVDISVPAVLPAAALLVAAANLSRRDDSPNTGERATPYVWICRQAGAAGAQALGRGAFRTAAARKMLMHCGMVIDEAQTIKNPSNSIARARVGTAGRFSWRSG